MPDRPARCPTAEQLAAYGLGRLPNDQRALIEQHLGACPTCRQELAQQTSASGGGTLRATPAASLAGPGGAPGGSVTAPYVPADVPPELAASGKFEVLLKLGEGGMGSVYLARRTLLDDVVAIKVMRAGATGNEESRARFLREMRATVRLGHPHIVRAHDADVLGELLFLVMEHVEGVSLDRLVRQKGPLPVAFACRCAVQAAEALQHAHERGMVHRDVKPANLMVTAKEQAVKVLDFGLVQVPKGEAAKGAQTQLHSFMGTPEYVSPEQGTDARNADIRSDVYSLGCTLYFLLTGRPPFRGSTMDLVLAHVRDEPTPLAELRPEVTAGLAAVVARMMAKKPAERYQTPGEAAEALRPFALPSSPVRRPRRPASHQRIAFVVGVLGILLTTAMAGCLLLIVDRKDGPRPDAGKEKGRGSRASRPRGDPPPPKDPQEGRQTAWGKEVENSIGMRLVRIPLGKFQMGSPALEEGRHQGEEQHEVELTKEFWMGIHEVTQKQFKAVMGYNPSHFSNEGTGREGEKYPDAKPAGGRDKVVDTDTADFPVENVSWEETKEFCDKLSALAGERRAGRKYRLPSEAEWEYCCRGGASSYQTFHLGNSLSSSQANFNGKNSYGRAPKGPYLERTCQAGSYPANAFGLFDLHGNVWEWCADWYDENYYANSPRRDPRGPAEGSSRVFRGGGWHSSGISCRSAYRGGIEPACRYYALGFRVALVPSGEGSK
jgi:formylglycine-generating enzyme required for sulfatase activity